MAGTGALLAVLKKRFKHQGLTYAELAKSVMLSEASVKRIMASGRMTLDQLDQFCAAAGTSALELARDALEASEERMQHGRMTLEQEQVLADDERRFILYYSYATWGKLDEACVKAGLLTTHDRTRALTALDRCGLIALHPHDRVVVRVAHTAQWSSEGPLMQKYGERIRDYFYAHDFNGDMELMRFHAVRMTPETAKMLRQRMVQIAADADLAHKREAHLSESTSVALVVAIRSWNNPLPYLTGKDG